MLWACLHFPALALNRVEQSLPQPKAVVIEITRKQRRLVLQANAQAHAAGIVPGMTIPTAQGLCADLYCVEYDPDAEFKALQQLGHWAYGFTPHIQTHQGTNLLLQVQHSLNLFQGREALAQQMLQQLDPGLRPFCLAFSDTAMAALLFAQANETRNQAVFFSLQDLAPYEVQWMDISNQQKSLLYSMGIKTLGHIQTLPRDPLAKRFGVEFTQYLNRLFGQQPDPTPNWTLPNHFNVDTDFPLEVDNSQGLLFPIKRQLQFLEQYLSARQMSVQQLQFALALRDRTIQDWVIALSAPMHRSSDILPLVQLKLETLTLKAPVLNLQLSAKQFYPLSNKQSDLFNPHQSDKVTRYQLVDRLQARLGNNNVFGLTMVADHRPEYSWSGTTPGQGQQLQHPSEQRPFWLLTHPQKLRCKKGVPIYHQVLQLLKGPERIETGWWDHKPINRDYFVAQENGRQLWVYKDRENSQWYLHGIFSA